MLQPPGFYYVKKPKRFVILSSDKSSERNLSCFFDIIKPRRMEHLQSEEPFSSDQYFKAAIVWSAVLGFYLVNSKGQRPIFAVQLGLPSAHQQFERVSTFSAQ